MHELFWDIETRSAESLVSVGAWRYAGAPSTGVWCVCYAVDDGEVETWVPEQPVPTPFIEADADPQNWRTFAHNMGFERAILERMLVPQHGFPLIPIEAQHCSQALALANGYPADLDKCARALGLEYLKDRAGLQVMRRMSRPKKARKGRKNKTGEAPPVLTWNDDPEDLKKLIEYCKQDVRVCRSVWRHPKLRHLNESERRVQILDAVINRRGVRADRELAEAARGMSVDERVRINAALSTLTDGAVTSVDQIERIRTAVNARGHAMESLSKQAVAAVLAHDPDEHVRELLELRRKGARASTRKYDRILAFADPVDDRLRGTCRFHGSATGRWSGRGPQLQNLKKNEAGLPLDAVEAIRSRDRERVAAYGNPLSVIGDIARAAVCAAPGHILISADFSAIESRILAWLAGETWKVDTYREFDRTGDKSKEPYRITAGKMLRGKPPEEITSKERETGKFGDLACGFGGSVGAWRRIAKDTVRSDEEILADVRAWRQAHPKTKEFWRDLTRTIRVAIRTGQPCALDNAISADFDTGDLTVTLPSGRVLTYPQARLAPNTKFEDGDPNVMFMDNARGKWALYRGWHGTFAENVVQATARDLLAAAIERLEARGIPVVLHVHDEVVVEVPIGSVTEEEFLAIVLEAPDWAEGLPLAGSVWSGQCYFEPPDEPPPNEPQPPPKPSATVEEIIADACVETVELGEPDEDDYEPAPREPVEEEIEDLVAPLWDLVSEPLNGSNQVLCPFHADTTPSCSIYEDGYHCHGCGAHGSRLDWLIHVEGLTEKEAVDLMADWIPDERTRKREANDKEKIAYALEIWNRARSIHGTIAARYLKETRGIDLTRLPENIDEVLRFHPSCVFAGQRLPCLLTLMRDPLTDEMKGIQRTPLYLKNGRVERGEERMMLGRRGVAKIWPAGTRLVVGEGLETVLAAATRLDDEGIPFTPAWALLADDMMATLPVLPEVAELVVLVDHDRAGQTAADQIERVWDRAGRDVTRFIPDEPGWDFNDVVLRGEGPDGV